ncbi:MAG TPA: hypothetical protein VE155_06520 [Pseudonocardiaceae bacterium]|nr:hypothetical protein [Pseudonocardiaceae bacterium]
MPSSDEQIRAAATDALYAARDAGKSMHGAAAAMVEAVIPLVEQRFAPPIDLAALAASIARHVGEEFPRPPSEMALGQGLSLSEESGELVEAALAYSVRASRVNGALRRMLGIARRSGTKAEFEGELADAFITLFLVAHYAQADPWAAIAGKAEVIFSRGWRAEPVA